MFITLLALTLRLWCTFSELVYSINYGFVLEWERNMGQSVVTFYAKSDLYGAIFTSI